MKFKHHKTLKLLKLLTIVVFIGSGFVSGQSDDKSTKELLYLNVYYQQAKPNDTLILTMNNIVVNNPEKREFRATINTKGYFKFEIPVWEKQGYFILSKPREAHLKKTNFENPIFMVKPQLWEAGDSINLNLNFQEELSVIGRNAKIKVTGQGSAKYNLAYTFDHPELIERKQYNAKHDSTLLNWSGNILMLKGYDQLTQPQMQMLELLEQSKKQLSPLSYNVLKANIIYQPNSVFYKTRDFIQSGQTNKTTSEMDQAQFIKEFSQSFDAPNFHHISAAGLTNSLYFLNFLAEKFKLESQLQVGSTSLNWIYHRIANYQINKQVKEILITRLLLGYIRNSDDPGTALPNYQSHVFNKEYLNLLKGIHQRSNGSKLLEFRLEDVHGNIRKLSEFKGKVLLIDIWFTGCGACSWYYSHTLSKVEEQLKSNNAVIFISISVDREKLVWKKSIQSGNYTSQGVVNLFTGGQATAHPFIKDNLFTSFPTVILIDSEGNINSLNSSSLFEQQALRRSITNLAELVN